MITTLIHYREKEKHTTYHYENTLWFQYGPQTSTESHNK